MTKHDKHLAIVKRAEDMHIAVGGRLTALMDIDFADKTFNLRLDDFLNADNPDFIHDFRDIQRHINRRTKKFENCFMPRFAGTLEGNTMANAKNCSYWVISEYCPNEHFIDLASATKYAIEANGRTYEYDEKTEQMTLIHSFAARTAVKND